MPLKIRILSLCFALLLLTAVGYGQQSYVARYDLYAGYAFLDSPHIGLFENGFQLQFGVRPKTWYSIGFDYSRSTGDLTLVPNLLPTALEQQINAEIAGLIALHQLPAGYALSVPAHSISQTFALGPQLAYRHFSKVTLFLRPSLGAIHENATPKPGDPFATAVAQSLAPSGHKTDWTGFYGFGYGVDLLFSKHVALRVQGDLVYDHLFNDLLKDGRWTTRFSVGPCFNFGSNIAK
jgi:hypothetical protein